MQAGHDNLNWCCLRAGTGSNQVGASSKRGPCGTPPQPTPQRRLGRTVKTDPHVSERKGEYVQVLGLWPRRTPPARRQVGWDIRVTFGQSLASAWSSPLQTDR